MALIWIAVAVAFLLAEVVSVAFFALFGAVGAVAAAIAAALGFDTAIQAIVFAVASLLGVVLVRPPLMRYFQRSRGPQVLSGAQSMVGQTAVVVDPIRGPHEPGHVRIAGENWPALSEDGAPVRAGREVTVVALNQATLVVKGEAK